MYFIRHMARALFVLQSTSATTDSTQHPQTRTRQATQHHHNYSACTAEHDILTSSIEYRYHDNTTLHVHGWSSRCLSRTPACMHTAAAAAWCHWAISCTQDIMHRVGWRVTATITIGHADYSSCRHSRTKKRTNAMTPKRQQCSIQAYTESPTV